MRASNFDYTFKCLDSDLQSDLRNCTHILSWSFHCESILLSNHLLILNLACNRWPNSCCIYSNDANIHSEERRPQSCWNFHHQSYCRLSRPSWFITGNKFLTKFSRPLYCSDLNNCVDDYCSLNNLHFEWPRVQFPSSWSNKNYEEQCVGNMPCFLSWCLYKHRWSSRLKRVYIRIKHSYSRIVRICKD